MHHILPAAPRSAPAGWGEEPVRTPVLEQVRQSSMGMVVGPMFFVYVFQGVVTTCGSSPRGPNRRCAHGFGLSIIQPLCAIDDIR
jgi:hypothetical protein